MPIVRKLNKNTDTAVENFNAIMEAYKVQNPVKYEKMMTEKVFKNNTMTEYEWKLSQLKGGKSLAPDAEEKEVERKADKK